MSNKQHSSVYKKRSIPVRECLKALGVPIFLLVVSVYNVLDHNGYLGQPVEQPTVSTGLTRFFGTKCSEKGYQREKVNNLEPKTCGIVEIDNVLQPNEVHTLRQMGDRVVRKLGEYAFDSGDSINLKAVKLHELFSNERYKSYVTIREYEVLRNVSERAKDTVSGYFQIPWENLYFSKISQFTRHKPITYFTEFRHVDKVRSPPLTITSTFWLTSGNSDFTDGPTEFVRGDQTISLEAKAGGFAAWTSSYENPHMLKDITRGCRIIVILGFTVDPNEGFKTIDDMIGLP